MKLFLLALTGPIVWALHFFLVYGTQTVLDVSGGSRTTLRIMIVLYTLVAAALIGTGLHRLNAGNAPNADLAAFMPRLGQGLAALSALAILWTTLPLLTN